MPKTKDEKMYFFLENKTLLKVFLKKKKKKSLS